MTTWRKDAEEDVIGTSALALLDARRDAISEKPRATAADEALFWLAEFPLGDDQFAVPLQHMRSALPLRGVTSVPLAPAHVIGILRFQGQVVTVLSLASLLGNPGWREDPQTLLVIELGAGRFVAVDCEQIPKPTAVPRRVIDQARSQPQGAGPSLNGAVVEVLTSDRRQIFLLDINRLLDRRRTQRDET